MARFVSWCHEPLTALVAVWYVGVAVGVYKVVAGQLHAVAFLFEAAVTYVLLRAVQGELSRVTAAPIAPVAEVRSG